MSKKSKKPKVNQEYQQVDVIPPGCLKCGSTDREPYHNIRSINSVGNRDGRPYTRITLKRTKCSKCGQCRVDRIFENSQAMVEG